MQYRPLSKDRLGGRLDPIALPSSMPDMPFPALDHEPAELEVDDEQVLRARALDGDVDALLRWRRMLEPIDYDEMGWGD